MRIGSWWSRSSVVVTLGCSLGMLTGACSSSKSTADSGLGFGIPDSSGEDTNGSTKTDGGTHLKDAASTQKKFDGACGSNGGSGWCTANSPNPQSATQPMCDDFDYGTLSPLYGWVGVATASLVNTHYVSAYCALSVTVADCTSGVNGPCNVGPLGSARSLAVGSLTSHPYTAAPSTGPATAAFDLYVPSGNDCNGAVVARFTAQGENAAIGDAAMAWLTISDLEGSGAAATGYTLSLTVGVGHGQAADAGYPVASAPVSIHVSPQASDDGWARLGLDISNYSFAAPAGSITGTATWAYRGSTTVKGTSTAASATGTLVTTSANGNVKVDVGLPPGPNGSAAIGDGGVSCQLFVDDFLNEL